MIWRNVFVMGLAVSVALAIMFWIVWTERPTLESVIDSDNTPAQLQAENDPSLIEIDESRITVLQETAESNPDDVVSRLSLADLYFGAEQFEDAIPWYEEAVLLDAENLDARTNLGVSYYYTDQVERAIEVFEETIKLEPTNQRALLSLGIVKAFGLQDLDGAMTAWKRVIEIEPNSAEGLAARDSLERFSAVHDSAEENLP